MAYVLALSENIFERLIKCMIDILQAFDKAVEKYKKTLI